MQTKDVGLLVIGFILTLIGIGFRIFEPSWTIDPTGASGAFIGAGVVLIIITFRDIRFRNKGTIVEDERIFHIAEKASHKTLLILIILEGTLIAFLGVTASNIKAYPIVSLLFAITIISYAGFFHWYKRQM
ncbi:DUF2178 domain-containing protein [Methanococcoides burtonii]|uniref:DUF2178 domain-containing protein n=1 Tax=Methanococcoides burtonii (strain DSM 6242 / NBRC 107633 / OCM 468 / ACE-M) TaxID=259564 RepID=Q12Z30_METBU|nr:DUF2178 domain-containing protein [Methanococcoides burtonii]ABE51296.1 Hypothetical protein Mbur_0293 [Methanococcoides burtonii DSM 6242]